MSRDFSEKIELVPNAEENLRIIEEACEKIAKEKYYTLVKHFDESEFVAMFSLIKSEPVFEKEDFDLFKGLSDRIQKICLKNCAGAVAIRVFVKYFIHPEIYTLNDFQKSFYTSRLGQKSGKS